MGRRSHAVLLGCVLCLGNIPSWAASATAAAGGEEPPPAKPSTMAALTQNEIDRRKEETFRINENLDLAQKSRSKNF